MYNSVNGFSYFHLRQAKFYPAIQSLYMLLHAFIMDSKSCRNVAFATVIFYSPQQEEESAHVIKKKEYLFKHFFLYRTSESLVAFLWNFFPTIIRVCHYHAKSFVDSKGWWTEDWIMAHTQNCNRSCKNRHLLHTPPKVNLLPTEFSVIMALCLKWFKPTNGE